VKVIKRDGREVCFDQDKIKNAIKKAFTEVDGELNDKTIAIADKIANEITNSKKGQYTVEEIQDIVETKLMQTSRKDVAKAYILYRNERTKIRDRNSKLVQKILNRAESKINNRSNANVDEMSFSGREKEASAEVGVAIAIDFDGLSEAVAKAHKEMLVYQHDLEKAIYGIHNCLQLNFQEIFTYGFRTRNGDVRPPVNFMQLLSSAKAKFNLEALVVSMQIMTLLHL